MTYLHNHFSPQAQTVQDRADQVKNNAGGYVYGISDEDFFLRWLILGTEGGTYYVDERALTGEALARIESYIQHNWDAAINTVVDVSDQGRSVKVSTPIMALAFLLKHKGDGYMESRKFRLSMRVILRTASHLYEFLSYVKALGLPVNGSATLAKGINDVILGWGAEKAAYQFTKYRQRFGWSARDVLRVAHPRVGGEMNELFGYLTQGTDSALIPVLVYEAMKEAQTSLDVADVLFSAPGAASWEMVPTQFLVDKDIWSALLSTNNIPLTALIRNLGRMSASGLFSHRVAVEEVANRLGDGDYIRKSRVHPFTVLQALKVYQNGHGVRGDLSWTPANRIVAALNDAYFLAFGNLDQLNLRTMVAVDVSGSMTWRQSGSMVLSAWESAASMASVMAYQYDTDVYAFSHQLVPYNIPAGNALPGLPSISFGRTDCALPMLSAAEQGREYDLFVILTDNETWVGSIKPDRALREYRHKFVPDAKLVVVGMTSTGFSIADPTDPGMLDVVGMDTSVFKAIEGFANG